MIEVAYTEFAYIHQITHRSKLQGLQLLIFLNAESYGNDVLAQVVLADISKSNYESLDYSDTTVSGTAPEAC